MARWVALASGGLAGSTRSQHRHKRRDSCRAADLRRHRESAPRDTPYQPSLHNSSLRRYIQRCRCIFRTDRAVQLVMVVVVAAVGARAGSVMAAAEGKQGIHPSRPSGS